MKLGVKLIHVEAGLRSFDRGMPEEINRVLTDSISDLLFCTEQSGMENLAREGVDPASCHLVGNCMVDTLLANIERARASDVLGRLGLDERGYAVVTLHRPSNVDDDASLQQILAALDVVQRDQPVVFPLHPRRRQRMLGNPGLRAQGGGRPRLRLLEPQGYLDFVRLCDAARVVLTDSGGIQEETTIMGVPCLTLRENTERPVTCELGTNQLVGRDPLLPAVTHHARRGSGHALQGSHRLLGLRLLDVAQQAVAQHDGRDHDRLDRQAVGTLQPPRQQGNHDGGQQQVDERIGELRSDVHVVVHRLLLGRRDRHDVQP